MRIKIILFILLSTYLYSDEVAVGIVGYTLLNDFAVNCESDSIITVDGKNIAYRDFVIDSSGFLISGNNEIMFNELFIKSSGITTFISSKGRQPYLGDFIITYKNGLEIINRVPEEEYLSSVLGSEMGSLFEDEALKAQLLCIKSYLELRRYRNRNKSWDILNTARVMAYRGLEYSTPRMTKLVRELNDIDLILEEGIEPLFFSTASGYILSQDCFSSMLDSPPRYPLILKEDNKTSPYYQFNHSLTDNELISLLKSDLPISRITGIQLKYFNNTECVDYIGFEDGEKVLWLKGYRFVSIIQRKYGSRFKSIQFSVYKENDLFEFTGYGFGHFVGMSQYGAQEMALDGKSYKSILLKFFPGAQVKYK